MNRFIISFLLALSVPLVLSFNAHAAICIDDAHGRSAIKTINVKTEHQKIDNALYQTMPKYRTTKRITATPRKKCESLVIISAKNT